jgi:hypothetical protein
MNKKGQAMVEFCVIITLLSFILLSIFQVAFLYNASHMARYAAFCAARARSIGFSEAEVKRAAYLAMAPVSSPVHGLLTETGHLSGGNYGLSGQETEAVKRVAAKIRDNSGLEYGGLFLFSYDFAEDMRRRFIAAEARTAVIPDEEWMGKVKEEAIPDFWESTWEKSKENAFNLLFLSAATGGAGAILGFINIAYHSFLDIIKERERDVPWVKYVVEHDVEIFDPFLKLLNSFRGPGGTEIFPGGQFRIRSSYIMKNYVR